jgi:transposase-like protein
MCSPIRQCERETSRRRVVNSVRRCLWSGHQHVRRHSPQTATTAPRPPVQPLDAAILVEHPLLLWSGLISALDTIARRRTTSQALALRARIVLARAAGATVTDVAADLEITRDTVRKWRSRFLAGRLEGLGDAPRPGAPRSITDEQVELVIAKTLAEQGPGQDTHWSTRSMATATWMSQTAVSRIWRAFGLKPHLVQTWKLSSDPEFIGKVRDVVGLYLDPPEKALVLCVDELCEASHNSSDVKSSVM